MKAIILAAGKGSRLRPAGLELPKCLLEVGGRPIIEHQLAALGARGIQDVLVVVGYRHELVMTRLGERVRYRTYPEWDTSNNFPTLWSVRDELADGFVCLFADVICDEASIGQLVASGADICALVDTSRVLAGTMRVQIRNGGVTGIGSHIPVSEGSGNFIGIAKFSASGARLLLEQMEDMVSTSRDEYYTVAVDRLAGRGTPIGYVDIAGRPWVEIDTVEDLERAHALVGLASK